MNQPTGVKQLSDYLKSHNVQINAILLTSGHIYHEILIKQLVSPPTALHLVKLKATNGQFESHLSRIADTICKKGKLYNLYHKHEISLKKTLFLQQFIFYYFVLLLFSMSSKP